jgi:phosphonate transport system substrate-binding protein
MQRRWMLSALAALISGASLALTATFSQAQTDCPRGTLDVRFCDRDGDLIADPPTDPKDFVDPDTLVFAYTPVEDPAVYAEVWQEFLDHLSKTTGKRVQFFPVQSNAAQIEAMRAGRLHVTGFNTGSTPLAVNVAGFTPFAMMASKTGEFGYEMEIIVRQESPIQKIEDLRGKTIAFTAETSNSGFKAPTVLLKTEFGLELDKDYKAVFSGKHDNSILGVFNKDYEVASIANSVLKRMAARNVVDGKQLRAIYRSQTFPTTAYGYVYNLKPELAAKVKEAFFTFKWEGTKLLKEFQKSEPPQETFIPISYKEKWEVIRKIDEASGVEYRLKS